MSFFFKLLGTWLLNLIIGGLIIAFLEPTYIKSDVYFPSNLILPKSFEDFFGDALMYAIGAGVSSCWLFIILFLVQVIYVSRGKSYKRPVVVTYWIGVFIYFGLIWLGSHQFPLFLISFLFFGIVFFRVFLKIKLWSVNA